MPCFVAHERPVALRARLRGHVRRSAQRTVPCYSNGLSRRTAMSQSAICQADIRAR